MELRVQIVHICTQSDFCRANTHNVKIVYLYCAALCIHYCSAEESTLPIAAHAITSRLLTQANSGSSADTSNYWQATSPCWVMQFGHKRIYYIHMPQSMAGRILSTRLK